MYKRQTQNFNLNFQISWEADLWNRLSNQERSAALSIEAQIGDQRAARLALAANVAKAWFEAIETEAQLQLLQQRKANLLDRSQVVEENFEGVHVIGFAPPPSRRNFVRRKWHGAMRRIGNVRSTPRIQEVDDLEPGNTTSDVDFPDATGTAASSWQPLDVKSWVGAHNKVD